MIRALWCLISLGAALTTMTSAHAAPVATQVSFELTHEPDGKKYPNQVKESYTLTSDGNLAYFAYFGGMPTDMNHTDGLSWASGAAGQRVFAALQRMLAESQKGLRQLSDSESAPTGSYRITIRERNADSGRIVDDKTSPAWRTLDAAFGALVTAFEKTTGRPYNVGQLPQSRR